MITWEVAPDNVSGIQKPRLVSEASKLQSYSMVFYDISNTNTVDS